MTTRTFFRAPRAGVLLLTTLAACTDGYVPTLPPPALPATVSIPAVRCVADVAAATLECAAASGPEQSQAIAANRLVGGQEVNIRLSNSGTVYDTAADVYSTNVTVQNLTRQALGTSDGSTVNGVRLFFYSGPVATGGTGQVTVANASGEAFFTDPDQPYFHYAEILEPYQVSQGKTWQFNVPGTVTRFSFVIYVQGPQPDESLPLQDKVWTGSASSAWSGTGNWRGGVVPDSASAVMIPPDSLMAGSSMPALTGNVTISDLRVSPTSTLDLSGYSLTAWGNVDAPGVIGGGAVLVRGTGVLLRGTLPSVTVSGSAALQGAVQASGRVSVAGGSLAVKDQVLSISVP